MSSFGQSTSVDPIATSTDSANLCHACECIEEFFMLAMLPWSLIKAGWLVSAGNLKQRCIWSLYCRWLQSLKWEWNQARRCVTYIWLKCTTGLPAGPITTSTFLWLLIVKQNKQILNACQSAIKMCSNDQMSQKMTNTYDKIGRSAGFPQESDVTCCKWWLESFQTFRRSLRCLRSANSSAWVQCIDAFSVWWCYVLCENASKSESCCIFGGHCFWSLRGNESMATACETFKVFRCLGM